MFFWRRRILTGFWLTSEIDARPRDRLFLPFGWQVWVRFALFANLSEKRGCLVSWGRLACSRAALPGICGFQRAHHVMRGQRAGCSVWAQNRFPTLSPPRTAVQRQCGRAAKVQVSGGIAGLDGVRKRER